MHKPLNVAAGLAMAGWLALSPVMAFADTSLGVYQTTDRKMDFALSLCGTGKELCVTLTAARGSADVPRVHQFIGKLVIDRAKPAGKNKWRGQVKFQKYSGDGTLTLHPGKDFVMYGCTYVVMCGDFTLIPAQ